MPRALALLLCAALGCRSKAPPAAAPEDGEHHGDAHRDEAEHEALPSRVRLPDPVLRAAGIRTEVPAQRPLPLTVDLTGEVVADPDRTARVAARVAGRVAEVRFKEGQRVAAGALLCALESPELAQARAAYLAARARAEAAQRNAERQEALGKAGIAAGQEVEAAVAESRAADAAAQAARRALSIFGLGEEELLRSGSRLEVRAPIAGFIVGRDATVGQAVPAGHVLADIVDLRRAYFLGRLFEKNLGRVRPGEAVEVRLNAYPEVVFLGTVETIGKQLDPTARTVVARIAISDQEDRLKVGLFGTARVSTPDPAPETRALLVPLGAVTRIAGRDVVFVRQQDDHFEVHPVVLGRSAGGLVEVLSGLRPGEQVVVEGVFSLKSAVLKGTFAEED